MGFRNLNYDGKTIAPIRVKHGVLYVLRTRNYWWQFWRPKARLLDGKMLSEEMTKLEDIKL